jgi:hypothetical protein
MSLAAGAEAEMRRAWTDRFGVRRLAPRLYVAFPAGYTSMTATAISASAP